MWELLALGELCGNKKKATVVISRGLGRIARKQTQSSKQWPLTTFTFLPLIFSKTVLAVIYSFCIFISEPSPGEKSYVPYTGNAIGLFYSQDAWCTP